MNKTVKTTKIEKKYTDKRSGQEKSITIDYAKVADREKAFREDNPRSKTHTQHLREGNKVTVLAYIWKDKKDLIELLKAGAKFDDALASCDATGIAEAVGVGEKAIEKCETVAIGRALAHLGYAMSGEIASSEEMEQFEEYKLEKHANEIMAAIEDLKNCSDITTLQRVFVGLPLAIRGEKAVIAEKDKMKEVLGGKDKNADENYTNSAK